MADSYTEGEIAGIVIGCLIGIPLVIFLILFALRMWMRGPTKGSDNTKKLDGKLVVITGKMNCVFINTVNLGDKEHFANEQIGVKEPFPVTNCQFTK